MLRQLIYIWDIIILDLAKMQVTYVQLFCLGENIYTSVYQWELKTDEIFSSRKRIIYFMDLNLSVFYIYNLLILTKGGWIYHVQNLELKINKLKGEGLKCSIEKSFFRQARMEYLGFWVTHDGVKPINKKIEPIINMALLTSQKEV